MVSIKKQGKDAQQPQQCWVNMILSSLLEAEDGDNEIRNRREKEEGIRINLQNDSFLWQ